MKNKLVAPVYLGVGTLEEFSKIIEDERARGGGADKPINIAQILSTTHSSKLAGFAQHVEVFLLSYALDSGEVLYLRAEVGYYSTFSVSGRREMYDPRYGTFESREENLKRVKQIMEEWFALRGYRWREAALAMPADYQYYGGVLEIMRPDENGRWVWDEKRRLAAKADKADK